MRRSRNKKRSESYIEIVAVDGGYHSVVLDQRCRGGRRLTATKAPRTASAIPHGRTAYLTGPSSERVSAASHADALRKVKLQLSPILIAAAQTVCTRAHSAAKGRFFREALIASILMCAFVSGYAGGKKDAPPEKLPPREVVRVPSRPRIPLTLRPPTSHIERESSRTGTSALVARTEKTVSPGDAAPSPVGDTLPAVIAEPPAQELAFVRGQRSPLPLQAWIAPADPVPIGNDQ